MITLLIAILLFLNPIEILHAKFDPLTVPNNKFGIHIADPNDINDAALLVNSSGGDWGYITLVIQQNDRDQHKWQNIFNQLRRLHIIPIVRIATEPVQDYWKIPLKNDSQDWANFLHSLNWPIENRYVVLFNEPNHAREWGNTINPEEYADIVVSYSAALRNISEDFFILPAGLDVSANSDGYALDAAIYLKRILASQPAFIDAIDGWTSHSYPNPGFSGSPKSRGRGTIASYIWEQDFLRTLGISKKLPIFITETGWVHTEGLRYESAYLSSEQVGDHLATSFLLWADPSVVAVTPFVFNYQGLPFDHFSWKKINSSEFYPHYFTYKNIQKPSGQPRQREAYTFTEKLIPDTLVSGSNELLSKILKNSGQGIITSSEDFSFVFDANGEFSLTPVGFSAIEPGQEGELWFYLETPDTPGVYDYTLTLYHKKKVLPLESGSVTLVPPPSATIRAQLGLKKNANADKATVLIYEKDTLLARFPDVVLANGEIQLHGLRNIVPGQEYRIVVLVPYYLPRQTFSVLNKDSTQIAIKPMLPFDLDFDGALTIQDLRAFFSIPPRQFLSLIL